MAKSARMESETRSDARELLKELAEIRASTRNDLAAGAWQWLTVWSLVFVGAAVVGLVPALEDLTEVYWLLAVPVALILTAIIAVRTDFKSRVRRRALPYVVVSLAMTLGAYGASFLLVGRRGVVLVWVVLGFGFAALAWIERQKAPAVLFAALGVLSAVLALVAADSHALYPMLSLAFGAAIGGVAAGLKIQADR